LPGQPGGRGGLVRWGGAEGEFLEVALTIVLERVDPRTAGGTELLVGDGGTTVVADVSGHVVFLRGGYSATAMQLWAIRPTETWSVGSILGAVLVFAAAGYIVWLLARRSAE
jgi:hypothetical protein